MDQDKPGANDTMMGVAPPAPRRNEAPHPPEAVKSKSIHPDPYARAPEAVRVTAPNLQERDAVARQLIGVCEEELKTEKDRVRQARLHYEMARLYEVPLAELTPALEHYQQARALHPRHVPTCAGLRRVRMLRKEWEPALKLLSEEVELADKPETRAALLYEKSVILEQKVGRPAEARKTLKEALDLAPGDRASLRSLLRLARHDQDWPSVDKLLEQAAQVSPDDHQLLAARLAEQAQVAELHRSAEAHAIELYQRSLEADSLSSSATFELERLLATANRHSDLVNLLKKRVSLQANPPLRAATLVTAGEHVAARLGDPTGAIELFELAHRETPEDPFILQRLEDLYGRIGDHEGRVSALRRQEEQTSDTTLQADLRLRIADIYRQRLDRVTRAIEWYEKARDLAPGSDATIGPLIALYEAGGNHEALVAVLLGEEKSSDDLSRRAEIHTRVADVYENQLKDVGKAIHHYGAALNVQPGYEPAFRELSRLLHEERRFVEVVELHERGVEWAKDTDEAIAHLLHIAQVQEDLLAQPGRALLAYQRVIEKRKTNLQGLRGIQRTATRFGKHEEAVGALEAEAALLKEPARKVPLLHRAGTLCLDRLGEPERALELQKQVVGLDPGYVPALRSIQHLHRAAGRHKELIRALEMELVATSNKQQRMLLLLEIGQIYEDNLSDHSNALESYQKAQKEVPDSTTTGEHVARMLAALGKNAERAASLETRIAHEKDPARLSALSMTLGVLYELHLGKPRDALKAYQRALSTGHNSLVAKQAELRVLSLLGENEQYVHAIDDALEQVDKSDTRDPSQWTWLYLAAASRLEGPLKKPAEAAAIYTKLLGRVPKHVGALASLERIHQQNGDTDALRRVLQKEVDALVDPEEQVAALRQMARIEPGHLEGGKAEKGKKGEAARAIFERDASDARALFELELAAIANADSAELASVDRALIDLAPSHSVRSANRVRLAEYLEPLNAVQALDQHRPALGEDQESIGAARGFTRIAEVVDDPALLRQAAEYESTIVRSPSRATSLFRRASLLLEQAGQSDEAEKVLQRALALNPNDAGSARDLHRLLLDHKRPEQLIGTLTEAAQAATNPEVRAGHWICVARLLESFRGDLAAAIAALERVEKMQPNHVGNLIELAELCLRDRKWGPASHRLERALKLKPDATQSRAIRLRLAELYHERLSRSDEAAGLLKEVLAESPREEAALKRLLAIQIDRHDKAASETAEAWAEVATGTEKAEALTTLGRIRVDQGREDEALSAFTEAVALSGLAEGGAAEDLVRLLERAKKKGQKADFSLYSNALRSFVSGARERNVEPEEQAKAYLEWGRTLADRQSKLDEAVTALRAGVNVAPNDFDLQKELAQRLKEAGNDERAVPEYYRLLDLAPLRGQTWADMAELFDRVGKNAEAHLAVGPMHLLGAGTELQRSTWGAREPRPALVVEGSIDATILGSSLYYAIEGEALAVLSQVAPLLPKVFPPNLESLGVSGRDRIGPRDSHPLKPIFDRCVRAFGLSDIDLYPDATGTSSVRLVLTDPLGIVLPKGFAGLTEAEQTFCLSRVLVNLARETYIIDALGASQTELILNAIAHSYGANVQMSGVTGNQLTDVARRLSKAVSWLSKGRFEDVCRRYASAPVGDMQRFTRELYRSAMRVSLILSDDLAPLRLIEQRGDELFAVPANETQSLVKDLLRFWISPESMAARRQMGLV